MKIKSNCHTSQHTDFKIFQYPVNPQFYYDGLRTGHTSQSSYALNKDKWVYGLNKWRKMNINVN